MEPTKLDRTERLPIDDPEQLQIHATDAMKNVISDTFNVMAGMQVRIGSEYTLAATGHLERRISGVIGWVGEWNGTGILDCEPEFAWYLANRMLGTHGEDLNEEALDVIAEMSNILFGGMKTALEPTYGQMGLSLPTVIYGNNVGMRSVGAAFTIVPFEIDEHKLMVRMHFVRAEKRVSSTTQFWAATSSGAL